MTGFDLLWFFEDLFYDLTHPGDANLVTVAARLFAVFIGGSVLYYYLVRPLILRPIQAARQRLARAAHEAHHRRLDREAERAQAIREAEARERFERHQAEERERLTQKEREEHERRIEDEKLRQREAEMAHERELARLRLEEQRLAVQAASAEQHREAAARILRQLEDDLK